VRGSYLEAPENRHVVTMARELLYGAAVLYRIQALRLQGVRAPQRWAQLEPLAAF